MFLRTGDILDDQYRIERSLRGGQGTVYLATRIHGREKKTFAIKRPTETGQEHLDAFRREIETHETLRFPGIPKFIEVVHDENELPHGVFDYIDGDDLAWRLSESGRPFDEPEIHPLPSESGEFPKSVNYRARSGAPTLWHPQWLRWTW